MSHAIDLDGVQEKLFILQHLAYGSPGFCRSERITSQVEAGYTEFDSCWGWTKVIVSNYLIECAVKLRMIEEHCSHKTEAENLEALEKKAMSGLVVGHIHEGKFKLTVREACNKIVHATTATIDFSVQEEEPNDIQSWDGQFNLTGIQNEKPWRFQLDVAAWAKAASRYLELLQDKEYTLDLGQDFN